MNLKEAIRGEWAVTVPLDRVVTPHQLLDAYLAMVDVHREVVRKATKGPVSPWLSVEIYWAAHNDYSGDIVLTPSVVSSSTVNTVYCKFGYGTSTEINSRNRDIDKYPFRASMRGGFNRQRDIRQGWLLGSRRADWVDVNGRLCRRIQLVVVTPQCRMSPQCRYSGQALREVLNQVSFNAYARPVWCMTGNFRLTPGHPLLVRP